MKILSIALLALCGAVSAPVDVTVTITPSPSAYYVATTGSDSNNAGNVAGTTSFNAPFATLGRCQTAMRSGSTKLCYIRAGTYTGLTSAGTTCDGAGSVIVTSSSDANVTFSYYPPDGYNTAIFDGGSSSATTGLGGAFCLVGGANGFTINGLQLQNFRNSFVAVFSNSVTITNSIIHDNHNPGTNGIYNQNSTGWTVTHNYLYNIQYQGVNATACATCSISNLLYDSNFIYNYCSGGNSDCGALYYEDLNTTSSTNMKITNNYVRDGFVSSGGARGIYLDQGASNAIISGNITSGASVHALTNHAGANVAITGNIIDLSTNSAEDIVFYQFVSGATTMTGNTFNSNIIIANMSSTGAGYVGNNSPPNPMTITNNLYHNYGTGNPLNSTGTGGAGSDASPLSADPQITCWTYNVAGGSPAFGSPINFPGITGGWGPPGFTVPQTGTVPSQPHAC